MKRYLIAMYVLGIVFGFTQLFAQNNSLTFDGVDDYVNFNVSPSYIETFTIEAWIKTSSAIDANNIVCWGNTGQSDNVQFRTSFGKLSFGSHPSGGDWISCTSSANVNTNEWTHVAVVKNGTAVQLYVNGIEDGSGINNNILNVNYMLIGKYVNDTFYFTGNMDEIRIWNDVRTASEIRQNMYQELSDPASESNLVAYYTFNNTSGTTLTDSKGSYNGTLNNFGGNYWQGSPIIAGSQNCLDFDGSNDFVTLPSTLYSNNLSGGTALTIEYWFKGTLLTSAVRFQYGDYVVAGWGRQFIISTDGGTEGVYIGTSEEIEDGNWHHIACVWEANTENGFRTYLDGVLKNQRTSANVTLPVINSGAWLGSFNNGEYISGKLDDVRIWNTARTSEQIRENMMRSLHGDENGLIAYYQLNESGVSTAYDVTANAYNGTLTNMDPNTDWVESGAFTTWLGGTSNAWSTEANWSDGIPTSNDNIGIYQFNDNHELSISGTPTVKNMLISSSASPTLSSGFTVNGNLILEKDIHLNGQTVTLGSSATLIEDAGVFSGTSGSITTTRNLNNINENVAGLGATITTNANMGSTSITRSHASVSGYNFKSSVLRQYAITPSTNTGLNANLKFNYLDSELNNLEEKKLQFVKSTDGGSTWSEQGGTVLTSDNTITLSGIDGFSTWSVTKLIQTMNNYALDFDGLNDYVDLPSTLYSNNLSAGSAITIEYWFKGTLLQSAVRFQNGDNYIVPGYGAEMNFIISTDGGADNGVSIGTSAEIQNGDWHHIACVWEANTQNGFKTYLDGVLKNQRTSANVTLPVINSGAWLGTLEGTQFLNGSLDEVRVWNTARSGEQIRENMTRTLNGDESGLIAYYHLNETSGITAYDATANSYNGTLTNMDGGSDWIDSEAFNTWLGGTSTAWSTATNWTDGVPTSTDNVGIYKWTDCNEGAISGTPEVNSLLISSTSSPTLSSNMTINGSLLLEKNMDLNGQTITLGSSATLIEDAGVFSGTSGSITTTRNLNNIDENVAGLGAEIVEDGNLGSTTIIRGHTSQGSRGIKRYFQINPSNSPSAATLIFHYEDSELNDLTESDLKLFKSSDGSDWTEQNSTVNTSENTITMTGINSFSYWTAAESGETALPISLSSFNATAEHGVVELAWETASETNNASFVIYRNNEVLARVEGAGTTSEKQYYTYIDESVLPAQTYTYVLADVDYANKENKYEAEAVTVTLGNNVVEANFVIGAAYPNPFNPMTIVPIELSHDARVSVSLYDLNGCRVKTLTNATLRAGTHDLRIDGSNIATGIYLLHITIENIINVQKIALMK